MRVLNSAPEITIRPFEARDWADCSRLLYESFTEIADAHGFPSDFSKEGAEAYIEERIDHPSIWGAVAEIEGEVVGFSFLREYNRIRAIGPIGVDPNLQQGGIGRALMQAMIERAAGWPGIRLQQDAFNPTSLALYAALGFEVKEPTVLIEGRATSGPVAGVEVRSFRTNDRAACEELCRSVYGFERAELLDPMFHPAVAVRDGVIVAYAVSETVGMGGHGVARSEADLQALIIGLTRRMSEPAQLLLPIRHASLFRWALSEGFRVVKMMNLMAYGEYEEPRGSYFPSISY